MRDDIHKRAPGGRRWQGVVKAASRNADWRAETTAALERVLRDELRKENGVALLHRLEDGYDLFEFQARGIRFRSPFQQLLRTLLQTNSSNLVSDAVVALELRKKAWRRELVGRLASDNPADVLIIAHRIDAAERAVSLRRIVESELVGKRTNSSSRATGQAAGPFNANESIQSILSRPR